MQCTPESEKKYGVRGIKLEYLHDYIDPADMAEREAQAYLQGMVSGVKKIRRKLSRDIQKNSDISDGLVRFIESNPELYFAGIGETENDMLKWALSENIKNTKALLDKIHEYEDKTGFPIIRKY